MNGMTLREAADFVAEYERQAADRKGGFGGLSGPWGRAVQTLVDHARATTPSDDRGRERRSLVLADREAELLELKGPCSDPECRLHYAHRGPCDIVGAGQ